MTALSLVILIEQCYRTPDRAEYSTGYTLCHIRAARSTIRRVGMRDRYDVLRFMQNKVDTHALAFVSAADWDSRICA